MPTFLVFKGGNKVKELVGANPGALQVGPICSALDSSESRCLSQTLITEAAANA